MNTALIKLTEQRNGKMKATLEFDPPLDLKDGAKEPYIYSLAAHALSYAMHVASGGKQFDADEPADHSGITDMGVKHAKK